MLLRALHNIPCFNFISFFFSSERFLLLLYFFFVLSWRSHVDVCRFHTVGLQAVGKELFTGAAKHMPAIEWLRIIDFQYKKEEEEEGEEGEEPTRIYLEKKKVRKERDVSEKIYWCSHQCVSWRLWRSFCSRRYHSNWWFSLLLQDNEPLVNDILYAKDMISAAKTWLYSIDRVILWFLARFRPSTIVWTFRGCWKSI